MHRDPLAARACHLCHDLTGDARHLFTECPHFDDLRSSLELEYVIPDGWWLPRLKVTTSTGFITFDAGNSVAERSRLLIASCKLGIQMCHNTECLIGVAPQV